MKLVESLGITRLSGRGQRHGRRPDAGSPTSAPDRWTLSPYAFAAADALVLKSSPPRAPTRDCS
jgi:hypothetical protein